MPFRSHLRTNPDAAAFGAAPLYSLPAVIVPKLHITPDRIRGCTPWLARALTLNFSSRCIAVNRRLRHVIVDSRSFWLSRRSRVIGFDGISRIVFNAQPVPVLSPWRYLSLSESGHSDSTLFNLSLVLKSGQQLHLFTIWERQPREPDWIDRLADIEEEARIGDEAAHRVAMLLKEYLEVPLTRY